MEAMEGKQGCGTQSTIYCQTEHGSMGSITGCSTALLLSAPGLSTTLYML